MYADYTYYRTLYGGKLPEQDYTFVAARASEYLASVTNDRITEKILEDETTGRAVKMCCCAMADLIQKQEQRDGKTAEKVGDYSVSYADSSTNQTARQKRRYELAYMYLSRYGLMFRGVE